MELQPQDARAHFQAIAHASAASVRTKLPTDVNAVLTKLVCKFVEFGNKNDVVFEWEIGFQGREEKTRIVSSRRDNASKRGVSFPKEWRRELQHITLQSLAQASGTHLRGHGDATCTFLGQAKQAPLPSSSASRECGAIVAFNEHGIQAHYALCAHIHQSRWLCYRGRDKHEITKGKKQQFDDAALVLKDIDTDVWPSNKNSSAKTRLIADAENQPEAWNILIAISKSRAEELKAELEKREMKPAAANEGFILDPCGWESKERLRVVAQWSLPPLGDAVLRVGFVDMLLGNALRCRLFPLPGNWRETLSKGCTIAKFAGGQNTFRPSRSCTAEDLYQYIAAAAGVPDKVARNFVVGVCRYTAEQLRRSLQFTLPWLADFKIKRIITLKRCLFGTKPRPKLVAKACKSFRKAVNLKIFGPALTRTWPGPTSTRGTIAQIQARLLRRFKPQEHKVYNHIAIQEKMAAGTVTALMSAIRKYAIANLHQNGTFCLPGLATWICTRIPERFERGTGKYISGKEIKIKPHGPWVRIKIKLESRFTAIACEDDVEARVP